MVVNLDFFEKYKEYLSEINYNEKKFSLNEFKNIINIEIGFKKLGYKLIHEVFLTKNNKIIVVYTNNKEEYFMNSYELVNNFNIKYNLKLFRKPIDDIIENFIKWKHDIEINKRIIQNEK